MGMYGIYIRTDDETIANIKNGKQTISDAFNDALLSSDDYSPSEDVLFIDKLWHIIHYTLSGEALEIKDEPLAKVVFNGNYISEEDMGMGPANFIPSDELPIINSVLQAVSKEWFFEKFSTDDMIEKDIYIAEYVEPEEAYECLENIKKFFKQATAEKQNILFFLE